MSNKKMAILAILTALALGIHVLEAQIPLPVQVQGVKLGLANLAVVIVLYLMDVKSAYLLSILRIVLSGFLFGNLFGILYSLAGGLLSLSVMILLKKTNAFSVVGVSVAGAVCHNIGQLIVATIVLESVSIANYLPVLMVAGIITGFVIGIIALETMKRLKKMKW